MHIDFVWNSISTRASYSLNGCILDSQIKSVAGLDLSGWPTLDWTWLGNFFELFNLLLCTDISAKRTEFGND